MRRFIRFTLGLLLTLIFASASQAQSSEWIRIESENKEISFAVPNNYSFSFDKQGFHKSNPKNWREVADYKNLRSLTAYENGAALFFESYDVKNAKKALPFLLSSHVDSQVQDLSFENFSGLRVISEKVGYTAFFYLASEKNIYLVGVGAREKTNETLAKFLNTVKLNGKTVFNLPAGKTAEAGQAFSIAALPETPLEIEINRAERKNEEKKNEIKKADDVKPTDEKSEDSKPLLILFKTPASYTDTAREQNETGVVAIRATFQANGQIGKIVVVKNLRYGLTENAISALKRVRFIPAEKDNAPVTVTKTMEYTFVLY